MSKIDFKVISISTRSHHNTDRSEFSQKVIIKNGENELEAKFQLLLDAAEGMDGGLFEGDSLSTLKEKFMEFMTNPTKYQISAENTNDYGSAMVFAISTTDEWDMTFHFAYDLGVVGRDKPDFNLIFCAADELNKNDNHWFDFHEQGQEELQKKCDELMEKSKEELAMMLVVADINQSLQFSNGGREDSEQD